MNNYLQNAYSVVLFSWNSSTDTEVTVGLFQHISLAQHKQNIEQDSCAVRQLQRAVEHGLEEVYPYLMSFNNSNGAGETSNGKGIGTIMLEVLDWLLRILDRQWS